jgi:L-iditol 2-dehydrogenase
MSIAPAQDYTIPGNTTQNSGVLLKMVNDLCIVDVPIPQPQKGEVQVQVKCTGICGSDCHMWKHGEIGLFAVEEPLLLGHESAGVVTAIGEQVTDFQIGDRVAIEAYVKDILKQGN